MKGLVPMERFSKLKPTWQSEAVLYFGRLFYSNHLFNLFNATSPTKLLLKLRKTDQIHQKLSL